MVRLAANIVCSLPIVGPGLGHNMQELRPMNLQYSNKNISIRIFSQEEVIKIVKFCFSMIVQSMLSYPVGEFVII